MSATIGQVKGRSHETQVAISLGGVEIFITWAIDSIHTEGLCDSLTPQAARGLAALLVEAANQYERMVEAKLARFDRDEK
jgi:hypothetical protein